MADGGPLPGPALTSASLLTRRGAGHLPGPRLGRRALPCARLTGPAPAAHANGPDRVTAAPPDSGAACPADLEDAPDRRAGRAAAAVRGK